MEVADIRSGGGGSNPVGGVPLGSRVVFRASNTEAGQEPWVTDGTAAGTLPLEIVPGGGSSNPGGFTGIGDEVLFNAFTAATGDELWRTDGTQAGTSLVQDIYPGATGSTPRALLDVGGAAVFRADDGTTGSEPWRSDGTAAGTGRIADINPGAGNGAGSFFFPARMGEYVYYRANEPVAGSELWRSPVAGGGAELVANVALAGSSDPLQLVPAGSTLFFTATEPTVGRELWRTEGTPGNFNLSQNFDGAATDSTINEIEALGSHVYVSAAAALGGVELWRADPSGVELVADMNGLGSSSPQNLTAVGQALYFTANDGFNGRELWRSDGEPGGATNLVRDINPTGSSACAINPITAVGDEIFFCATDGSTGNELWRSDGTTAGTVRVADINPGAASSSPQPVAVHGDTFYFSADDGSHGSELWAIDTGAPETTLVSGPGSRTSDPSPSFELSSGAVDLARFECSPTGPGGTFAPCGGLNGSVELPPLPDGARDIAMRAVDVRDNADASPLVVPLTIDTRGPRVVLKGKLRSSGGRAVKAKLACKRSELSGPCRGKVALVAAGGPKGKLGSGRFSLKPGKTKRAKVKLTRRGRALLGSADTTVKVRAKGRARDSLGNGGKVKGRAKLVP
ncbi:MAG: hypothetical protein R2700_09905 [Solirubrobacterales bacterium]